MQNTNKYTISQSRYEMEIKRSDYPLLKYFSQVAMALLFMALVLNIPLLVKNIYNNHCVSSIVQLVVTFCIFYLDFYKIQYM